MRNIFVSLCLLATFAPSSFAQPNFADKAKAVLAQIEGEIRVPGLKEPVEVLRDRWGVPHIYAKNADDLFFAQGFVVAQDRLFQLDLWRRIAAGEMAEILGLDAIEGDTFARLIRYRGDMDTEWRYYSRDTKQIATAFTKGINAWIKHTGDKLPIEFQILGYRPKRWQPEDILGRMSGIVMSRNFNDEVLRAHLIHKLGIDKVRLLMPTDPPQDFAPVPGLDVKGIGSHILEDYKAASKAMPFSPVKTESNNWAVAGSRSVSGMPLLASDPHRLISVPSLRYLVHLNAPGWNVIGAGEPALPGVALGHNERIAWGITIVGTDQADIFVEETNPLNPSQYKVGDKWVKMVKKVEHLKVNLGKGELMLDKLIELRYTRHGPVLYQDSDQRRAYVLKWAGSEPGGAGYLGGLAVSRAQNKAEFLTALESWKIPSLNFMYADKDGNIGWVAAGAVPIRPKHDGLLPVPGNGGYEWTGYLDVEDLPQTFNPKSGWLGTANHNIIPKGYKHQIAYEFAAPYRFLRVKQGLEAKDKYTLDDFQKLQHDDVSIPGQKMAKLLNGVAFADPSIQAYAKIMRAWDGKLSLDSQAGVIYAYWLRTLQEAVYAPHDPTKKLWKEIASKSGLPTMLHALENPDAAWFGKNPQAARDAIVANSFVKAVAQIKKRYPQPEQMRWGTLHTVTFKHALSARKDVDAKLLNIGPFERTGDGNTPNNTRYDDDFKQLHGASYRHVFDLADWDKGLATSCPGQSGQPGSPHYADLAPLWAKGQYFPLAYSRKKVDEVTQHKLMLRPTN